MSVQILVEKVFMQLLALTVLMVLLCSLAVGAVIGSLLFSLVGSLILGWIGGVVGFLSGFILGPSVILSGVIGCYHYFTQDNKVFEATETVDNSREETLLP